MCDVSPKTISDPLVPHQLITAAKLLIVPLGKNKLLSFPNISATLVSSSLIVGSSPKTSSPTKWKITEMKKLWKSFISVHENDIRPAAVNILCLIDELGIVTVSLRRSIRVLTVIDCWDDMNRVCLCSALKENPNVLRQ